MNWIKLDESILCQGHHPKQNIPMMIPQCIDTTHSTIIVHGYYTSYLVGGWEHFLFFHILGIVIKIDFHIFQRGSYTTNHIHRLSIDYP